MPWNCLCSKEKKRPHISAPILDPNNEDENQKLMPIIKSPKNHHNHQITTQMTTISKQNIEKFETKLKVENEKLNKKSKKEKSNLLKQQQKESIKLINQNENVSSSSSSSPVVSVIEQQQQQQQSETKINRQLVNVKFSFDNEKLLDGNSGITTISDDDDDDKNNNNGGKIKSTDKLVLEKIDENLDENDNENGNYDVLPLISVEEVREQSRLQDIENGNNNNNQQIAVAHVIAIHEGDDDDDDDGFAHSTESIPYIDDEQQQQQQQQKQTKVNFHDEKFITATAQNSPRSNYTKTKLFDKSVQLLYQIINQTENETNNILYQIMHDFMVYENFDQTTGKLCQVCHHCLRKPLVTIRCKSCNFTCHQYCVDVPGPRYFDTAYVVYQQWINNQLWTSADNLRINKETNALEIVKFDDEPQPSSKSNGSIKKAKNHKKIKSSNSTKNKNSNEPKTSNSSNSNENLLNTELKIVESLDLVDAPTKPKPHDDHDDDDECDKNIVCSTTTDNNDKVESSSTQNDIVVISVDIHQSNNEAAGDDGGDTTAAQSENVPEPHETNRSTSVSRTSSMRSEQLLTGTEMSVKIKRKRFLNRKRVASDETAGVDIDDDDDDSGDRDESKSSELDNTYSSFDESDQDPVYERVAFNKKNFDGNQAIPKSQTFPVTSANQNHHLHAIQQQQQHQQPVSPTTKLSDTLRLSYVTERILSSILPKRTADEQQSFIEDGTNYEDKYEREIIEMLEQKHGKNYRLFDLESCIQTITLEKLCELCKHIDSWLGSGREKVVVLQDRGDRQRLGTAIAAYLEYQKICGSNFPRSKSFDERGGGNGQGTLSRNWLDLDIFSMQKFLEDVAGPLRVPSHKRYLQYFSGLLSGNIKMNSSPLFLKYVSIESPPSWMSYNSLNTQSSEWKSFLKIYEGLNCVFTTDIHVVPISTRQFIYEIGNLRLRGDVTVRCYQILLNSNGFNTDQRELMFSVQFHTCAVTERNISFGRADLDYACDDPRFPNDHKLLLNFDGFNEAGGNRNLYIQSPLIRIEPGNSVVTKWDSFEHLNEGSSHTQGPLDGSLYATISKSPKSPQPSIKINFLNGLTSTTATTTTASTIATPAKPLRGSTQNLISPPPEFRNHQQIQQQQQQQIQNQSDFILENNRYQRSVSVPVNHISNNNNNNLNSASSINQLTKTNSIKRNPSSVTTYQTTQQYSPQTNTNQIRIVETTTSVVENTNNGQQLRTNVVGAQQQHQYPNNDGRESSVRSPLTLSMDSGISSSCIVNRRTQGSSVSPSSFPSQASPQEDRHRELDDILTDMLMTVQDIPDFSSSTSPNAISKSQSLSKVQQQQLGTTTTTTTTTTKVVPLSSSISSSVLASSQQNIVNTNTIKRSQSYNNNKSAIQTATNTIESNQIQEGERYNSERDIYDTSSTTTTLTPPPSESGRETPVINYRDKINENHIIMEQQHQSFAYPQSQRNDILISEENIHHHNNQQQQQNNNNTIPYHAREDSRPFSYGNIPTSPQQLQQSQSSSGIMLKMQSGLSSPSLVRKHLGINPNNNNNNTLTRKTPPRNEFEEMLRERREKVLSEKYSISDNNNHSGGGLNSANNNNNNNNNKIYQSDSVNNNNKQWYNTLQSSSTVTTNSKSPIIQQSNGYHHYHEPLKRSNTMDGGFGRQYSYSTSSSTTSDCVSGQTWLQLQQQKLRAKKEQQHDHDYRPNHYEQRVVRTEIVNNHNSRPVRSRSNASRYNDGYVSDTAAFGTDEVDYRRPLHVQTPHGQSATLNRSNSTLGGAVHGPPDRNYNTIQTTTVTTTTKERPFVAVKRAHEQAKQQQQGYNSQPPSALSVLNATPNGHVVAQAQSQNGLLSFVDSNSTSNVNINNSSRTINNNHNNIGHGRLESDITNTKNISSTANNDNEACMNVINNNTINCNNNNNHDHLINNNHNNSNINDDKASGQLALDRLLASLAQQMDFEYQTSNKNTNNNTTINRTNQSPTTISSQLSIASSPSSPISSLSSYSPTNGAFILNNQTFNNNNNNNNNISNKKEDLSDVITNLTEYNNSNLSTVKKRNDSASISPSLSERSNGTISWNEKTREESFSSYRSENEQDLSPSMSGSRPETPAFPVTPRTPLFGIGSSSPALPPKSPTSQRKDLFSGNQTDTSNYNTSRRNSTTSNTNSEPQEVAAHHVKCVRDSSKYWYKPHLSRDEAVNLLRNAAPGTFIIRDSTTFVNAFGLVIRVSHPPPGVQPKGPPGDELVRHFLIEPTTRGVRLKGCANEPVFTSLSALAYQHSITPLALPCKLLIPDREVDNQFEYNTPTQQQILDQGAACNVLYLFTCDTESLTGPQAVRKGVSLLFSRRPLPTPTTVHFKVSRQGITLTDNTRRLFFRKHHPANNITFIGLDPDGHMWSVPSGGDTPVSNYKIFAFIAKRSPSSADNQCHVFCELDPRQPASAIVNYAYKAIPSSEHSVTTRSI